MNMNRITESAAAKSWRPVGLNKLNRHYAVQECDARGDDSSNEVGYKKNNNHRTALSGRWTK